MAGNPPVRFASASFEAENETHRLPDFRLFLTRVFLFDFFGIGVLPITEVAVFPILYICLLRLGGHPIASAVIALILVEINLVLFSVAIKKSLVGSKWGSNHSTTFWSWRHFAYFFAQDCFFVWCRSPLAFCAGTVLANSVLRWMGCHIGQGTIVTQPMQCSDWNAVNFGNDCVVDGFLQFHTFENMMLKVKRTHIQDGCTVAFGATVMGGAVIERDTTLLPLSLVLKEMNMITATYEGSPAEPVSGSLPPAIALRRRDGEHSELPGESSYRPKGSSVYEANGFRWRETIASGSTICSPRAHAIGRRRSAHHAAHVLYAPVSRDPEASTALRVSSVG